MVEFVTFKTSDELPSVEMKCDSTFWVEQAETFFNFLVAQGFVLSEKDLAEFYVERAEDMGDLRSNTRVPSQQEIELKRALDSAVSEGGETD